MENALHSLAFLCIALVFVRIGTFNSQGSGRGVQYRSTIFPTSAVGESLHPPVRFRARIVTLIEAGRTFYRAEDYHQDFRLKIWAIRISSSTICRKSPIGSGCFRAYRADPMRRRRS
jgi:hypothetical protein